MYFIFLAEVVNSSNRLPVKTHVFGRSLILYFLFVMMRFFEIVPAGGSFASISDLLRTNQEY